MGNLNKNVLQNFTRTLFQFVFGIIILLVILLSVVYIGYHQSVLIKDVVVENEVAMGVGTDNQSRLTAFDSEQLWVFIIISVCCFSVLCLIAVKPLSRALEKIAIRKIFSLIDESSGIDTEKRIFHPESIEEVLECFKKVLEQSRIDSEQAFLEEAESVRKSRESELRAIVNTVLDGIITIDQYGTLMTFNPAAERIFGYSKDQVIGVNVKCLMPKKYAKHHDDYLHIYLSEGQAKVIGKVRELVGRKSDGTEFPIELSVSEMWVSDQKYFTGTIRDISERKENDLLKNKFIATVSHELRTPLTSIHGALGLLINQLENRISKSLLNMLKIASRNTSRLTLLINDLLDLEKYTSGNMVIECNIKDLKQILQQSIDDNHALVIEKNVRFQLHMPECSMQVHCDENRILQVMANLLSNAVKFSNDAGKIEIWAEEIDEHYWVYVKDQGSGIPQEFRKRIFDRFAQANGSDTRRVGGTGLGLSISKCIVELHGGTVGFNSTEGVGSTFHFTLPKKHIQSRLLSDKNLSKRSA